MSAASTFLPEPVTVIVSALLYKRRLAEMLLDVVLIAVAYYGAYRLRFEGGAPAAYMAVYQSTLGLVIALKISAFGLMGVYRGAWRYSGIVDLYRILGAIVFSSAALFWYMRWRVPLLAYSNILYIDALLTTALVLAARLSFRSLEMLRSRLRRAGARVAIYGAGDGGEMAVRELRNNAVHGLQPFCFLDDDPRKHGERIHGVPVLGGLDALAVVAERHGVRRVLIATNTPPAMATPKCASRIAGVLGDNIATRSPRFKPARSSAVARRCTRSPSSAYVNSRRP